MCEIETADDGLISWNIEYDIDCDIVRSGESEISIDGYSPEYSDECEFCDVSSLSCMKCLNSRLSVSGSKQIKPGMTYAGGWGRAVFDKAERNGSRLVISGNAYITSILCGEGEAVSEECVIPVKYECEAESPNSDKSGNGIVGKCEIIVCDTSGRCDGETLNVTAELALNGVFLEENGVRYLSCIKLDTSSRIAKKKNVIKICVPDKNESEWDIMKRYRVADSSPKKSGGVYIV